MYGYIAHFSSIQRAIKTRFDKQRTLQIRHPTTCYEILSVHFDTSIVRLQGTESSNFRAKNSLLFQCQEKLSSSKQVGILNRLLQHLNETTTGDIVFKSRFYLKHLPKKWLFIEVISSHKHKRCFTCQSLTNCSITNFTCTIIIIVLN